MLDSTLKSSALFPYICENLQYTPWFTKEVHGLCNLVLNKEDDFHVVNSLFYTISTIGYVKYQLESEQLKGDKRFEINKECLIELGFSERKYSTGSLGEPKYNFHIFNTGFTVVGCNYQSMGSYHGHLTYILFKYPLHIKDMNNDRTMYFKDENVILGLDNTKLITQKLWYTVLLA